MTPASRRLAPYLVTVFAVLCAVGVKVYLARWLGDGSPFLLTFTAVLIASWYGGFRQGLLATFLGFLFATSFYMPLSFFTTPNLIRLTMFVVDGVAISAVCSALRRSQEKSSQALREMRAAQHSRLVSETRFRRVYDSNMIGLIFFDRAGRIHEANDYFLDMIGYDRDDLAHGLITRERLTPVEYMPRTLSGVDQLNRTRRMLPYEKEYLSKRGERVPVMLGAAAVDEDMSVCFVLDMRARKNAERALEEAYNQLEDRVVQRTAELQEANRALKRLIESEEKSTEEMRQSQSFLDSVIENIPNMIVVKDARTLAFVRFNKAGEDLLGFRREDMIGKSDRDFFPADQAKHFNDRDREALSSRTAVTVEEERIQTRHGLRFLRTTKLPILDREGEPRYLLVISEDITEQKINEQQKLHLMQAQAARDEAEKTAARLAFLSEASAALSGGLDPEAMLAAFGRVVVRDFATWCLIDLVPESDREKTTTVVAHRDPSRVEEVRQWRQAFPLRNDVQGGAAHAMRTGKTEFYPSVNREVIKGLITDPDTHARLDRLSPESLIIVPLRSYGHVLGAISFVSADKDHHYDEFDLSIAHDLAKRVSDAIENTRLYSRAQEASRAKSAFLANMSHEIRTPLGAMIGFAELIAEGSNLTPDQVSSSATIVRNGRQLLRIVDEILDLSKVESERIQIENMPFSLPRLLREVGELLSLKAQEKHLNFEVREPAEIPDRVITDPTRLRQILINVIGNAIKFTQEGFVRTELRILDSKHGGKFRRLEFLVADSGIGIDREQEERLFQPFAQADESTTRRFGGTGLGLFLSRRLARLLGGDLVLDHGYEGPGSRFRLEIEIELPEGAAKVLRTEAPQLAQSAATTGNASPAPAKATANPEPNAPPVPPKSAPSAPTILIVDDAADNRALLGFYVSRMGYAVETAENGREGVAKAQSGDYALVLMDIQMPELDGFAALRLLKEAHYPRPVIALTAHAMKGDRERCLEEGFDDYLSKPIDREQLRQKLELYAKRTATEPETAPAN